MSLPPRYRNYWLDLLRKEMENEEKERKKTISSILDLLGKKQLPVKKKP
jgi:hypothetical protein